VIEPATKPPTKRAMLARISVYPVKGLDPIELDACAIATGGALAGDRRFALVDGEGRPVSGKRCPTIHRVRARHALAEGEIELEAPGAPLARFRLAGDQAEIEAWLGRALALPVRLVRDDARGFPDDTAAWGPTVISTASLAEVAGWFPGLAVDGARRRFRANLEIDGVPAFWEDRLFGPAGATVPFRIGDVLALGTNPCARCVVPTRDPDTGDVLSGFQKAFVARRRATLPGWADAGRFDHFYRLAVNTRIDPAEAGKRLSRGDELQLLAP
jgi:hypothetical protein